MFNYTTRTRINNMFRRRLMMHQPYDVYTIYSNSEGASIYFDGAYTGVNITNGKGVVKIEKEESASQYSVTLKGGNVRVPKDTYTFNVRNISFDKASSSQNAPVNSYLTRYTLYYPTYTIRANSSVTINYDLQRTQQSVTYTADNISGSFIRISGNKISVSENATGSTRYGSVTFRQYGSNKTGNCNVTQYAY